ncbi:phosphatidylserine lipase ABHD16A isoform X1 [Hydra vulgaris]|uniref:phosphatidylserine lipase ABHD16A isoform X1 n=1 Tax=Hydra vulgaris TaxID=6087 RepID=UPI001F5FF13E|nr:phosphatidylserine lipase ABHD16A [Hydra vulgaris]
MYSLAKKMFVFVLGPRLYRIFRFDSNIQRKVIEKEYLLNTSEWIGESFINTVSYALAATYYCSPIVVYYLYQNGIFNSPDQVAYYLKVFSVILITLGAAFLLRGNGRLMNPDYKKFIGVLEKAKFNKNDRDSLQMYDFDFASWPIDFSYNESSIKPANILVEAEKKKENGFLSKLLNIPMNFLEYILAHGLARPMGYPGSVKLLQTAMAPAIHQGRTILIEKNGIRSKLLAKDGNEIDTMFLDKRKNNDNGNTLVICCEGNAAFYEVGCMGTPLKGGYSVLGWNHPGFMGSSGTPSPSSEGNAIDVVVRYAVSKLGFKCEDIVLFAWSIGGYAASYAAMVYPNIKGVILDATFDDITSLAIARMPAFASSIVLRVINNYMNLNNTRHLIKYSGPIRLIRRLREEIITTIPHDPSTNRCNFLLEKILSFRYPNVVTKESIEVLHSYLSVDNVASQAAVLKSLGYDNKNDFEDRFAIKEDRPSFPLDIGRTWSQKEKSNATIFLAMKYLDHFDASHCVPLPSQYFLLPWQHKLI